MGYKVKKDSVCDSCGTGNVPLDAFAEKWLCFFCAESTGRAYEMVTKKILAQMFHVLLREMKRGRGK